MRGANHPITFPPQFSEFIHVIYFQFASFAFYCVALVHRICPFFFCISPSCFGDVQLNECKQMAKEKLKHVQVEADCSLTCFTFVFLLLIGMREGCEDRENDVGIELG